MRQQVLTLCYQYDFRRGRMFPQTNGQGLLVCIHGDPTTPRLGLVKYY